MRYAVKINLNKLYVNATARLRKVLSTLIVIITLNKQRIVMFVFQDHKEPYQRDPMAPC